MSDWPAGYGRLVLDEVDSTLNVAREMAGDLAEPTWILAHRQTAARGRRGRRWAMAPGNFAATLVMRPAELAGQAALRSFVMSLALLEALEAEGDQAGAWALKWPNDVLLDERKLAGILLESAGGAPGLVYLAIGVGVNLVEAPPAGALEAGAMAPVSLHQQAGRAPTPEVFLHSLAVAYARREAQFIAEGFAPIRQAWLARAARRGTMIRARMMQREVSGIFEDVDAEGNLVLGTPGGQLSLPAADIYF